MNTFNPLEKDCLRVRGKEIKKRLGVVPTNANIFFAIYQAIISGEDEEGDYPLYERGTSGGQGDFQHKATQHLDSSLRSEWHNVDKPWEGYYRRYEPDFFDLIVIDECHRGGANQEGNRAEILKYFSSAVQLGMTATPKRSDNIDTYAYFGAPVYEYSLKEGINDGFLTPYKVKRIQTNIDELVIDHDVQIISGDKKKDLYEISDFDRTIIVPERIDLISKEILKQIHPQEKTIIFCVDQEHALRVRDAINAHKSVADADYCVRVTSNEGEIWRQYLERFQDNDKTIPTILTSSQMLTTGVDARNVRNIVLLRNIGSMTEFKQIIGRGTRVFEGKDYFTIIDFTGATNLFYDPAWDGDALSSSFWESETNEESSEEEENSSMDSSHSSEWQQNEEEKSASSFQKLRVKLSDQRELRIINVETRYVDEQGKPISPTQYLESLIGKLPALYQSEEQLRILRADPKTREELLHQLQTMGIDAEQLHSLQKMFDAPESDIFDILAHLSFSEEMKTKEERASRVIEHSRVLDQAYQLQAKEFLEYLLQYYVEHGSTELVQSKIWELIELFGQKGKGMSIMDITSAFWGYEALLQAWKELQGELFRI